MKKLLLAVAVLAAFAAVGSGTIPAQADEVASASFQGGGGVCTWCLGPAGSPNSYNRPTPSPVVIPMDGTPSYPISWAQWNEMNKKIAGIEFRNEDGSIMTSPVSTPFVSAAPVSKPSATPKPVVKKTPAPTSTPVEYQTQEYQDEVQVEVPTPTPTVTVTHSNPFSAIWHFFFR